MKQLASLKKNRRFGRNAKSPRGLGTYYCPDCAGYHVGHGSKKGRSA